ncbi:MepB family protein [Kordia sp. YSTF-M3]|uniref:MepB family protein n=1 Tax=Kordia aestuariivivens TaxID=2759037 RepID=A0ABR7Q4J4_9FLAO|nr:MepB family protein [Kordia aestuariivivens]MBC8753368.1 MepB family protein [Kordia aestuariivivens]
MNAILKRIQTEIYERCGLKISNFTQEAESAAYDACQFDLTGLHIVCRNAKITPKKVGQFVTFWKRNNNQPIAPFHESDRFDFFVVNVHTEHKFGQFVFPKSILITKGIISTPTKEGKRAFRVYPNWDITNSKQAARTQKWQLNYFYELNATTDLNKVLELYKESTIRN